MGLNKIEQKLMRDKSFILLLKCLMAIGIFLIILGIYFHLYNSTIASMGVNGIIVSAACVAIGMILSIPTKMVITFLLVNREINQNLKKKMQTQH
jgi:hypothetical protein